MFKKELYRYNSNYQNCKYYSYRLTPPFRRAFYKYFGSTSVQSSAIEDFQVAAMFSLYRTMSGTRSRRLPFLSLSPSHPFRRSFSRPGDCSTFCKSSDISTGVCSTFNLAPVNERTLISLSRVSRVRDSGVAFVGECCARNATNLPAFRHREHHDSSDYSIPSRCLKRIRRKFDLN